MKQVSVCFLWHMHQPYYTDPVTLTASMPWVRLHATKAYYDMAVQLTRFPSIAGTVNFTPSLLIQLEEIAAGTVTDIFLEHARKPAADLSLAERAFIVRHFFSANWTTMVRPSPRYQELLAKRGTEVQPQDLERLAHRFSDQEITDLQVWHNLAWFGYGAGARLPYIDALRQKDRGFSGTDKQTVLEAQVTIMREIIPTYRSLAERGQIELTTSPFYHPILPLLIDLEQARRALPHLPALPPLRATNDAEAQLRNAVDCHTRLFGQRPKGLWPSEGSVCPELMPLLAALGLEWCATDEAILERSCAQQGTSWDRTQMLYRPYRVGPPGEDVTMVFRDRAISDAFGFAYQTMPPNVAVDDAMGRLHRIAQATPAGDVLIPIVLDGENPWEHYPHGGEAFLSQLYERLHRDAAIDHGGYRLATETMGQAMARFPSPSRLQALHTGSWINADFGIWIGHPEDRQAWQLLTQTRQRLVEISPSLAPEEAAAAWDELYAAEGSDWFWWYGDEFATDFELEFDRLFRTHLRNVWIRAGLFPPDDLHQSILTDVDRLAPDLLYAPSRLIDPKLDGRITSFFEWRGAGAIRPSTPLGTMWTARNFFSAIAFGFSLQSLFLRLDPLPQADDRADGRRIEWELVANGCLSVLSVPWLATDRSPATLAMGKRGEPLTPAGTVETVARDQIIEIGLPFERVHLAPGQSCQFSLLVVQAGRELARYPLTNPVTFQVPTSDFDAKMWRI